jgi:hypothetical protein
MTGKLARLPLASPSSTDTDSLHLWLAEVANDPLAFTLGAYPWGEKGTVLEDFSGPEDWAIALMNRIRDGLLNLSEAIQEATASGHGIAKSATVAHIIMWAFCTFPDCRGVITANTETQLKTKTWAELGKWFNLCWFARQHFTLTATALFSKDPDRERTWRIDSIAWSEKNPTAFAGLHNQGKRILLVFDEASEIHDVIWETAEGALTDSNTQIMWLVFGNPTRSAGRFRECFPGGLHHEFWHCTQIDSRTVRITNKQRLDNWIRAYGEDSDFVRIRVKGMFPRHGEQEFFSAEEIDAAMSRELEYVDKTWPLAIGVDVARFGFNTSVIFPRKGRDARTIERRSYSGLPTTELTNKVVDAFFQYHPDGIFIDGGGVGGGVVDQCRQKRLAVTEVQFGGKDDISGVTFDTSGERYANKRAAMYGALRAWLKSGYLPADYELKKAMLAIRYTFREKTGDIILNPKEDIMSDNPGLVLDDLDALALTFGGPLVANDNAGGEHPQKPLIVAEYDPYEPERMWAT